MTLIMIGTWYLYAGAAVAVVFLIFGLSWLDENAQGAWVFRSLLIPGVLLVWPLVLWRCWVLWRGEEKLDRHRMPRRGQDHAALLMVCAIPLILIVALTMRQAPAALALPIALEATE